MTKTEFIIKYREGARKGKPLMLLSVLCLGGCLLVAAFLPDRFTKVVVLSGVILCCFFLVASIAMTGTTIKCVHCGARLEHAEIPIAIATGHCGRCGEKAFEEESSESENHNE